MLTTFLKWSIYCFSVTLRKEYSPKTVVAVLYELMHGKKISICNHVTGHTAWYVVMWIGLRLSLLDQSPNQIIIWM